MKKVLSAAKLSCKVNPAFIVGSIEDFGVFIHIQVAVATHFEELT
jgi:hypothetical protein